MAGMAEDRAKFSIVDGAKYSLEQVQSAVSYNEERALEVNQSEVQKFLCYWDQVFLYGLKSLRKGYWAFVSKISHPSLVRAVMSTPGAVNDLTRSRVWLASILNENSLECYLVIISTELKLLNKFYRPNAILRTSTILQDLIAISCGSENTFFSIHMDYICYRGNEIFIGSKSDSDFGHRTFDTGLQQLESRSRSGSNVSIISTRSTFLERSFKAPFEPSRSRFSSLAADYKSPVQGRYPFVKSDSDEISIGVEAELINSPDSLGEEIGEYCQEEVRRDEERRRTLTGDEEESVEVVEEDQTEPLLESMIVDDMSTLLYPDSSTTAPSTTSAVLVQSRPEASATPATPPSHSTPVPSASGNYASASSPSTPPVDTSYSTPPVDTSYSTPRDSSPAKPHHINIPGSYTLSTGRGSPIVSSSPVQTPPVGSLSRNTPPVGSFPRDRVQTPPIGSRDRVQTPLVGSLPRDRVQTPPIGSLPRVHSFSGSFTDSGVMRRKMKLAKIESLSTQPVEPDASTAELDVAQWSEPPISGLVVDDPNDLSALLNNLTTEADREEEEREVEKREEEERLAEEERIRESEREKEEQTRAEESTEEVNNSSELLAVPDVPEPSCSPYEEEEVTIVTEEILEPASPLRSHSLTGSSCSYLSDISKTSEIEFINSDCVEDVPFTSLDEQGQEIVFEEPYIRSEEEDTESYKEGLDSDDSLDIIATQDVAPGSVTPVLETSTSNTQELSIEHEILHASIEYDRMVEPPQPLARSLPKDSHVDSAELPEEPPSKARSDSGRPVEQDGTTEVSGRSGSGTPEVAGRSGSGTPDVSGNSGSGTPEVAGRSGSGTPEVLVTPALSEESNLSSLLISFPDEEETKADSEVEEVEEVTEQLEEPSVEDALFPEDEEDEEEEEKEAPIFGEIEMDRAQADYQPPHDLLLKFSLSVFSNEEEYKRMIRIWLKDDIGNLAVGYVMLSTAKTYILDEDFSIILPISYSAISSVLRSPNWQVLTLTFVAEGEKGEIDLITGCEAISRGIMQGFMMYSTAPVMWSDSRSLSQCRLYEGVDTFISTQNTTPSGETDMYYVITFWEPLKGETPPTTDYPMTQGTLGLKEPTLLSYVWRDYYFILDGGKLHQMGLQCSSDVKKIYTVIGAGGCKHMKSDETTKKFAFKFTSAEGSEVMLNCKDQDTLTRWMQVVCETAMEIPRSLECAGASGTQCSVILRDDWLIVLREGLKSVYTLSAAPLNEVHLVQWFPAENFCILTIAEDTRQWLLLFRDAFETDKFLELLWEKWSTLFSLQDSTALFTKLHDNSDNLFKARNSMKSFRTSWEEEKEDVLMTF